MRFFHGTSSKCVELIKSDGFNPPVYFTTSMEDAEYYAATGGEESLQIREELYKRSTGINARKHYYPDMWDMYRAIYPTGEYPVVIEVELPEELVSSLKTDSGAEGGKVSKTLILPEFIVALHKVTWP
jgi:hypothetical protein